ncbi:hypothetical protein [Klebsiella pneumoniae]|uniref:hypothetical protein n=1 Tax=Klebsiella pneumoniae TaxID=573 RepID=UPI00389038E2
MLAVAVIIRVFKEETEGIPFAGEAIHHRRANVIGFHLHTDSPCRCCSEIAP